MPRKQVISGDDSERELDLRDVLRKNRGRPKKEETDDPRAPIAVGTLETPPQKPHIPDEVQIEGAQRYTLYARALVANGGQPIPALMAAFGIEEKEAVERAIELRDEIRKYSRSGVSLQELLEKHDLTSELRIATLREMLFSTNPAVKLKAIEMIDQMDVTAKSRRIGTTWDDIVRVAKDRASRALAVGK